MLIFDRAPVFIAALLLILSCNLYAASAQENVPHATKWNNFVENLLVLHKHRIKNRDVYTKENIGGYGGVTSDPEFYREVRHYDAKTDMLLSSIKWENNSANKIHAIEIYIYDDQGRILRDYSASYLPVHRNAPYQTLINIHQYNDKLHSSRQFDASGNLLYEFCTGTYNGKPVTIALDDYEIPDSINEFSNELKRDTYRACFNQLTNSAGVYLNPRNEF